MNVNFEAIEKAWFKPKKTDLIKDYELTCYKNYELKQENEKLKAYINYEKQQTKVKGKIIYGDNREELQQRIDKAIKYINKNSFLKEEFGCWFKCFKTDTQGFAQKLLNILKESDKK